MRRQIATLFVAAIVCRAAAVASAHEIGATQATGTFRADGSYQIDIAVDPDALAIKLALNDGDAPPSFRSRAERDESIEQRRATFLRHVAVEFDGVPNRPRFEYRPVSAVSDFAQTPSIVRLTGARPVDSRVVRLSYGLAAGTYAFNVRVEDSATQTFWLEGSQLSEPISLVKPPPPLSSWQVAARYFGLGYTHILPKGLDHILFVIGIFLLSTRWRSILLQVSTFTIAHSITLGLTMYGVVSLPPRIVEPMIALSIVYVAIENLAIADLKPWRLALIFSFGLLHGMGFAGVLRDVGLPGPQFLTALVTFNVGVEAGQLSVIALAFAAIAYWRRNEISYRRLVVQPASLAIALTGAYWTLQRALF